MKYILRHSKTIVFLVSIFSFGSMVFCTSDDISTSLNKIKRDVYEPRGFDTFIFGPNFSFQKMKSEYADGALTQVASTSETNCPDYSENCRKACEDAAKVQNGECKKLSSNFAEELKKSQDKLLVDLESKNKKNFENAVKKNKQEIQNAFREEKAKALPIKVAIQFIITLMLLFQMAIVSTMERGQKETLISLVFNFIVVGIAPWANL